MSSKKTMIWVFVLTFITMFFAACTIIPKGQMEFGNYMEKQKIPLTCRVIIPESSRNYQFVVIGTKFSIGPLFCENVPIALKEVLKDVSTSATVPTDITITAYLNNFSLSMSGIFPVVNASVLYELNNKDGVLIKKLISDRIFTAGFNSPSGPDLYKLVIKECLEELNAQIVQDKSLIMSKIKGN